MIIVKDNNEDNGHADDSDEMIIKLIMTMLNNNKDSNINTILFISLALEILVATMMEMEKQNEMIMIFYSVKTRMI